mmetsp:Transcript_58733/g.116649  ORF Transcript_58733/g.116649 Transcript_58733/m.116649 type:complete len:226 (-) Transcript_58733:2660-3337(-)
MKTILHTTTPIRSGLASGMVKASMKQTNIAKWRSSGTVTLPPCSLTPSPALTSLRSERRAGVARRPHRECWSQLAKLCGGCRISVGIMRGLSSVLSLFRRQRHPQLLHRRLSLVPLIPVLHQSHHYRQPILSVPRHAFFLVMMIAMMAVRARSGGAVTLEPTALTVARALTRLRLRHLCHHMNLGLLHIRRHHHLFHLLVLTLVIMPAMKLAMMAALVRSFPYVN